MKANINAQEAVATRARWDAHYTRDRARQSYPDENLVRLLAKLEIWGLRRSMAATQARMQSNSAANGIRRLNSSL
jgi:hypothetical protein